MHVDRHREALAMFDIVSATGTPTALAFAVYRLHNRPGPFLSGSSPPAAVSGRDGKYRNRADDWNACFTGRTDFIARPRRVPPSRHRRRRRSEKEAGENEELCRIMISGLLSSMTE